MKSFLGKPCHICHKILTTDNHRGDYTALTYLDIPGRPRYEEGMCNFCSDERRIHGNDLEYKVFHRRENFIELKGDFNDRDLNSDWKTIREN